MERKTIVKEEILEDMLKMVMGDLPESFVENGDNLWKAFDLGIKQLEASHQELLEALKSSHNFLMRAFQSNIGGVLQDHAEDFKLADNINAIKSAESLKGE